MADTKISGLPASTTPLAGTEVLPIVQGGATRQVNVANLTAGRALSATQLTLTTGNLIVASGQGIDFSATPGTGTSELLADYEEGTFTPTWTPSTSGTITLNAAYRTLAYTKVGRVVTITGQNVISSVSSPIGTSVNITGLPFAVGSTFNATSGFLALDTNSKLGVGALAGNTATSIEFYVNAATLGTNSSYAFSFSYIV